MDLEASEVGGVELVRRLLASRDKQVGRAYLSALPPPRGTPSPLPPAASNPFSPVKGTTHRGGSTASLTAGGGGGGGTGGRREWGEGEGSIVEILVAELRRDDKDTRRRQQLLACLQRLSILRAVQDRLFDLDMVSWLVTLLLRSDTLSETTVEFSAALLLNLAQRTRGQHDCAAIASQFVSALGDLLEHDKLQVREYTHGILYAALAREEVHDAASAVGLDE
ncbi:hypothetical protein T484DRAFT_1780468, partial [Baffinella frigidus]